MDVPGGDSAGGEAGEAGEGEGGTHKRKRPARWDRAAYVRRSARVRE